MLLSAISLDQIRKIVEDKYQLSDGAIFAYNRRKTTSEARYVTAYLSSIATRYSQEELGEYFCRDHKIVSRAKKKIESDYYLHMIAMNLFKYITSGEIHDYIL